MSFESGVKSFIHGQATVTVGFPVDFKGNTYINCSQCFFFREASRRCGLTGDVSQFPTKYVGATCPLEMIGDDE